MNPEQIAKLTHEINAIYCDVIGEESQSWADAPECIRVSVVIGVNTLIHNPELTPEQMHENWFNYKQAEGWKYGPVKDVDKKEHPCMVSYSELPKAQRVKDLLFTTIVKALI